MTLIERNLKYFIDKHGEVYQAYEEFGQAISKGGPLDEKTQRLIKVAISTTEKNHYSLKTHIKKALKSGCTMEEIEHTILLVAPTAGFPTAMSAIIAIREELGKEIDPREANID